MPTRCKDSLHRSVVGIESPWAHSPVASVPAPGARDLVCSTRFAEPLNSGIGGSELVVFEHLSHAGLHEDPETFNRATLDFLLRQPS